MKPAPIKVTCVYEPRRSAEAQTYLLIQQVKYLELVLILIFPGVGKHRETLSMAKNGERREEKRGRGGMVTSSAPNFMPTPSSGFGPLILPILHYSSAVSHHKRQCSFIRFKGK